MEIMPHSTEAEQALLGALLRDGECLGYVLEVFGDRQELFYDSFHQAVYRSCLELSRENHPVDLVTVTERLQASGTVQNEAGKEYLIDLAEAAALTINATHYARIVRDKAILRELIRAGQEIAQAGMESGEVEDALDAAQQKIFSISQGREQGRGLVALEDLTKSVWDHIEHRYEQAGGILGLPTGFADLDALLSGLQPSDLIIVAARPSMGKTAFCLNIAEHAAMRAHKPVALFSLEMSKEQLVSRLICSFSGVDAQRIRLGKLEASDWERLGQAMGTLSETPVFIDDSPALTVMDIRAKARRLKAKTKDLGLIIIDYIQLMQGRRTDNRVQEISEISRGLKTLARELQVPIVALSQLSRGVEARHNKRPMLSDLRESGAIEQDADVVMFLYRHEYYEPDDTEHRGECEVIISKQRNGPVGTVKLVFSGATTRFKNMEMAR